MTGSSTATIRVTTRHPWGDCATLCRMESDLRSLLHRPLRAAVRAARQGQRRQPDQCLRVRQHPHPRGVDPGNDLAQRFPHDRRGRRHGDLHVHRARVRRGGGQVGALGPSADHRRTLRGASRLGTGTELGGRADRRAGYRILRLARTVHRAGGRRGRDPRPDRVHGVRHHAPARRAAVRLHADRGGGARRRRHRDRRAQGRADH